MPRYERRLQRYAFLTLPLAGVAALAVAGALRPHVAVIALMLASVPVVWAWGPYHAHLALNGSLDEVARSRWRIAFSLVPPSMAVYWLLHVRRQSAID